MDQTGMDAKDGSFKRLFKGFLAVFGLALAITACSYVKNGFTFFKEGKAVELSELSSSFAGGDKEAYVRLDKKAMRADVGFKGFSASSMPFSYVDGCLAISSPEGSDQDCTVQVIDPKSVYWAAADAFMVSDV